MNQNNGAASYGYAIVVWMPSARFPGPFQDASKCALFLRQVEFVRNGIFLLRFRLALHGDEFGKVRLVASLFAGCKRLFWEAETACDSKRKAPKTWMFWSFCYLVPPQGFEPWTP